MVPLFRHSWEWQRRYTSCGMVLASYSISIAVLKVQTLDQYNEYHLWTLKQMSLLHHLETGSLLSISWSFPKMPYNVGIISWVSTDMSVVLKLGFFQLSRDQKSDNARVSKLSELKLLGVVLGIRVIPMWNQGKPCSLTLFLRHLFQICLFNNSHRHDSKMFAIQEWGPGFYYQHPDKKLYVECHC